MVAPPPPLHSNGHQKGQSGSEGKEKIPELAEDRTEISRCLLLKRQRNLFDLVALCDLPVDRYAGDSWILEEYFIDHQDDYLVSVLSSLTVILSRPLSGFLSLYVLYMSPPSFTLLTQPTLFCFTLFLSLWPADRCAQWAETDKN